MSSNEQEILHDALKHVESYGQEHELTSSRCGAYGPHVKIVCKPAQAPSCDLVVRVRVGSQDPKYGGWREVARFNDMSDDLAYTHAAERARAERRKLMENEQ